MARIRRPKKITGSEYTFGGGSGAGEASTVSGFVKIAKGHPTRTNANHDGFLNNKDTVNVALDEQTSIPTKDQYIYFDNAFETNTGQVSIEYVAPTTGLPSGVSWTNDNDGGDSDKGSGRIYGTPNAGTEGKHYFKIKVEYSQGSDSEQTEINYVLNILPAGTTPVWSSDVMSIDRIIRNTAGEQTLADGPTTTYADVTYTMTNVTGFDYGVTPVMDSATGRVYVTGVGDIVQASSEHSFTVNVNLGEYGVISKTFTNNLAYGDPFGARYFGPANANQYFTSQHNLNLQQSIDYFNVNKSSGALRRIWNAGEDTSPYIEGDGYGCEAAGSSFAPDQSSYDNMSGYNANGRMGIYAYGGNVNAWGGNHGYCRGYWEVPPGVEEICVVAVGGGSGGAYNWASDGGGGGGLAWLNGISVTPGEILQWCFGLGRQYESGVSSYGAGPSWIRRSSGGPNTDFLVFAQGGGWTGYSNNNPTNQNASYTGNETVTGINHWDKGNGYQGNNSRDGGGWGVNTNEGRAMDDGSGTGTTFHYGGGAAYAASGNREGTGAGGYRGNNASSGHSQPGYYGGAGNGYEYSSTWGEGAGGGVGLDGQGWRGYHQQNSYPRTYVHAGSGFGGSQGSWTSYNFGSPPFRGGGGGGSGGTRGAWGENQFTGREENSAGNGSINGGLHGGGGGGSGTSAGGGNGGSGAVRIIWGNGADGTPRCFPYTYCSENPNMKFNGES